MTKQERHILKLGREVAYYYRSAIPYINAIKKGERNYDNQIKIRQK